MRINQFIAAASGLSRRAADAAIAAGRVTVNDQPAELGQIITSNDAVQLGGQPLKLQSQSLYVMLNKPVGYVSSHARQGNTPTLYELLPPQYQRLRLVGRLDRESSGLIILSNDGNFIQRYAHPSQNKEKIYELSLDKTFAAADAIKLERGVVLEDGPSRVRTVQVSGQQLTVSLSEGRNRQLRRTFGALGYGILRLHRISVGPFQLGDLPSGHWREFTPVMETAQ